MFSFFIFFHFLSFSIIFYHFLSFSFTFFHFSFSFIFYHFLSFSIFFLSIFFHLLSSSFIFIHFLSFSCSFIFFLFVGCSKSDFFGGLNFVTISLDSSYVKKSIFCAHLGRYKKPLGLFTFFPHFFSFFDSSFLFLNFFFFFIFLFLFFIFLKKKVSSFLFSCISLKYVLLLALVLEFNCFLRSRFSMEMWCPDDMERDSWIGLGRLLWGEHASTP